MAGSYGPRLLPRPAALGQRTVAAHEGLMPEIPRLRSFRGFTKGWTVR
jgi:hypothetical protein